MKRTESEKKKTIGGSRLKEALFEFHAIEDLEYHSKFEYTGVTHLIYIADNDTDTELK